MSNTDTGKTFTLTSFRPVGFMCPNFPVKICPVCRGLLQRIPVVNAKLIKGILINV